MIDCNRLVNYAMEIKYVVMAYNDHIANRVEVVVSVSIIEYELNASNAKEGVFVPMVGRRICARNAGGLAYVFTTVKDQNARNVGAVVFAHIIEYERGVKSVKK
jgi:hypothetical protein